MKVIKNNRLFEELQEAIRDGFSKSHLWNMVFRHVKSNMFPIHWYGLPDHVKVAEKGIYFIMECWNGATVSHDTLVVQRS